MVQLFHWLKSGAERSGVEWSGVSEGWSDASSVLAGLSSDIDSVNK